MRIKSRIIARHYATPHTYVDKQLKVLPLRAGRRSETWIHVVKFFKFGMRVLVMPPYKIRRVVREFALPRAYSVLVYTEGGHYYAKDSNGNTICADSPTACLQESVNYVVRKGGGRILVKRGTYNPKQTVNIPDGAKLIIEGEGDSTVFRYIDPFTLFLHTSSNPTWTSVLIFRNFKIDRSGSGSNNANIIYVLYALYDEYDNITIVDDYREVGEDVGLYGRNSIVSIVKNSRFFNKAAPVWFHSYLVHIHSNYARNTSLIGFGAGNLLPESVFGYKQPPGYPLDGLVVIENNACIDCGRGDEAYAVDNEGSNPYTYGTGIIRSNSLISQDYTVKNAAIICANVDRCIIEDNFVNVAVQNFVINASWKATESSLVVVRNNKINSTSLSNVFPILIYADKAVIEGNDIMAKITADGSDVGVLRYGIELKVHDITFVRNNVSYTYPNALYNQRYFINSEGYIRRVIFKENLIDVSYPSNISSGYGIDFEDINSKNAEFIIIENNNIKFSAGRPLTISLWGIYPNPPLIRVIGNKFYSGKETNILIGLRNNNTVKATILNNELTGVAGVNLYADAGIAPMLIFTDRDAKIVAISPTLEVRYEKRNSGSATFRGDGTTTQFSIPHRLSSTPTKVLVTPASRDAADQFYVTADSTYIYVNYLTAPPAGTNNIVLNWYAEV